VWRLLLAEGVPTDIAEDVAAEVVRANNVGTDAWWLHAAGNKTLPDRIHEARRAVEKRREQRQGFAAVAEFAKRGLNIGAAVAAVPVVDAAAPVKVASPKWSKAWRTHPGCNFGMMNGEQCPSCAQDRAPSEP